MDPKTPHNPLAAYLSGEASEEQIRQVEEWLSSHEENRDLYQKLSEAWSEQNHASGNHFLEISSDNGQEGVLEED
ncbi:MAG: hypothetical protein R3C61_04440 [Bacteroidia bacterium]